MTSVEYFIPDSGADTSSHVIAAYLAAHTAPDDLIVDPFCISSTIVTEAVQTGRRVAAISFSPLHALRTRLALTPVPTRDLDAAVTRLSDSPKHGVPLRGHLQHLYRTTCRQCGKDVVADYFIWEHDKELPSQVRYHCPSCGDAGLRDCTESDAQVLQEIEPRGLHYWYVLDRMARHDDEARRFAADLLELYTPRNLYALSNLVLKIEDLLADSVVHDLLRLALLQCLELGSKLNAVPGEPAPAQPPPLRPLPRFVERNIWQLFEDATRQLNQPGPLPTIPLAARAKDILAPPSSDEGGRAAESAAAFVGHMSVRELATELTPGSIQLVLTWPPPLGRTRWAMSYLWTGWLCGHKESALLWPLVRRRRSDWPWYLRAMRTTFSALQKTLKADGHIVFLAQDEELAFHETLALAGAGADLRLETTLYHPSEPETATKPYSGLCGDYRFTWTLGAPVPPWPMSAPELAAKLREVTVAAAQEALRQRGEPAPFVRLHCHIWQALAQQGLLQRVMSIKEPSSPLSFVREQVRAALEEEVDRTFVQLLEDEQGRTCLWWLTEPPDTSSLTDRVERTVHETLQTATPLGTAQFTSAVYRQFPGVLTPDPDWVMACLKSYGMQLAPESWVVKEGDREERHGIAQATTVRQLMDLGQRLGHKVTASAQGFDVQWVQAGLAPVVFVVLDSASLSRVMSLSPTAESGRMRKLVVIPEAREDLIRFRLERSAWMRRQLTAAEWQFIRDADVTNWASQDNITMADLDSLVGLDRLSLQDRTQLPLI